MGLIFANYLPSGQHQAPRILFDPCECRNVAGSNPCSRIRYAPGSSGATRRGERFRILDPDIWNT